MFRFTIRDVLWLTVVVALSVGWWLDRNNLASLVRKVSQQNNHLAKQLAEAGKELEHLRSERLRAADADLNGTTPPNPPQP